jgi:O-antigen ligase
LKEIQFALPQLINNPILGLGFETPYRPAFYNGDPLISYIHVAYLYLWLKTGFLGLVAFVWFSILALLRGLRYWRMPKDNFLKAVALGTTLAFMSMMFSNLVAPSFTQQWSLAIFSLLLGVNEVIFLFPVPEFVEKKGDISNG